MDGSFISSLRSVLKYVFVGQLDFIVCEVVVAGAPEKALGNRGCRDLLREYITKPRGRVI